MKKIGCILLLLVLLPAIGFAQAEEPFYRLTQNEFLARYSAIAGEPSEAGEPILQELISVDGGTIYMTALGAVTLFAGKVDSDDSIDSIILLYTSLAPADDLQHCAIACEIAIRAADPSLSEEEVAAILAETFGHGTENRNDPFGVSSAEKNGVLYFFNPMKTSDEMAYSLNVMVAE
ncbi:MAG: hypothetical protein LBM74_08390 [Oscillospiraceae bacterium]|jgi:hypothetical protein|nr:hypothetical protein [Oscillospiraceae bacterium]